MVVITNFGDVQTTGNTTVNATLNVLGAYSYFSGTILGAGSASFGNVGTTTLNAATINVSSLFGTSGCIGIGTTNSSGTSLYVQGNVYASNALTTTNIFSVLMNVTTLNAASLTVSSIIQGSLNVGNTITATNVFAAGTVNASVLNVSSLFGQTAYVSNSVTTTNVFASGTVNTSTINVGSFFTSNLVINSQAPQGATLYVSGNAYVSNSVTTTNVFASGTVNTSTINVGSFFTSNLVINSQAPQGATLYVSGNAYVSNSVTTTNVYATVANVVTLNSASVLVSSLTVTGNLTMGNSLTTQTIYYGQDLFKRGPFLQPSPTNGPTIQSWISATCNASSQPVRSWWATSPAPVFGNVGATSGVWYGSLLLPDGRVLFVPQTGGNLGFFSPSTGLFSTQTFGPSGFSGGVLTPSGNVVLIGSNVVVLNPLTLTYSNIPTGASGFMGGVLTPTGNVAFPVLGNIGLVNPYTFAYSNLGPVSSNLAGAVLLPNGNVFFGGSGANSAVYNTSCVASPLGGNFTNVFTGTSNIQSVVLAPNGNVIGLPAQGGNIVCVRGFTSSNVPCGGSFLGGCLLPSGNLVCGGSSSNVGMFDTTALSFSNLSGSAGPGATLLQDGRVIFGPLSGNVGLLSTMVSVDQAWALSPYFNKF